eukprot:COSAG04_NODE_2866_length_3451_cov_2.751492_3_plen_140_part_00
MGFYIPASGSSKNARPPPDEYAAAVAEALTSQGIGPYASALEGYLPSCDVGSFLAEQLVFLMMSTALNRLGMEFRATPPLRLPGSRLARLPPRKILCFAKKSLYTALKLASNRFRRCSVSAVSGTALAQGPYNFCRPHR